MDMIDGDGAALTGSSDDAAGGGDHSHDDHDHHDDHGHRSRPC
ncbi:MAG: hypothetical protein J07HN6_02055 [Halonotius sp. J07HN6]|nr:MAG: hypothetical protein J07HN6_02055 [Halonotius sp. J07HN6]